MAIFNKFGAFLEKFDEWIIAGLLIPVGKVLFDQFMEKGAKKIEERVEKILGINIEEAKKDITDEILYSNAVYQLDDKQQQEVDAFEERLRREEAKKAEAFILFVAKMIKQYERDVKETTTPKKGEAGPKIEQSYKNIAAGIDEAKKFLLALLAKRGTDNNVTHQARVAFLQGKNVFSLIPPEKIPNQAWESTKKFGTMALEEVMKGGAATSKEIKNYNQTGKKFFLKVLTFGLKK